jgi:hypothetical protein
MINQRPDQDISSCTNSSSVDHQPRESDSCDTQQRLRQNRSGSRCSSSEGTEQQTYVTPPDGTIEIQQQQQQLPHPKGPVVVTEFPAGIDFQISETNQFQKDGSARGRLGWSVDRNTNNYLHHNNSSKNASNSSSTNSNINNSNNNNNSFRLNQKQQKPPTSIDTLCSSPTKKTTT